MSLTNQIHRISQIIENHYAQVAPSELTARQVAVLEAISRLPSPSQTAVVEETGIDRSTLAEMVRRLVHRGFVIRKRSKDDARAYVLQISGTGLAALKAGRAAREKAEQKFLKSRLAPADQAQITRILGYLTRDLAQDAIAAE